MKKISVLFTTLILVLTIGVTTAFAAPDNFVKSPSGNSAPQIQDYSNSDPNCKGTLGITSYGNKNTLNDSMKNALEDAYNSILNADNIASLNEDLVSIAKDKNIPLPNLAVSDLFYLSCENCDNHDQHGPFKVKLSADTLKNFVGLMYFDGTNWVLVKDAAVDSTGSYLTFTTDFFGPYAVVVNTNGADVDTNVIGDVDQAPQTSDDFSALWIALMVVSALGLGVVAFVFVKQNRKTER